MEEANENVSVIEFEGKTIRVSDFPSLLTQQVSLINDNTDVIVKAKEKAESKAVHERRRKKATGTEEKGAKHRKKKPSRNLTADHNL